MRHKLYKWWQHVPATVRKPFVFILGLLIVIIGIILLPLPGPGWLVIFLGFAILATEFAFAERIQDWLIRILKQLIEWGKQQLTACWPNPLRRNRRR